MKKIIVKKIIYIYNSKEGEKMMVNNKGITLIALIITIIIILIITGITIYEGSKIIDETKYEDVKTNMLLIQAEVKIYVEQASFENKKLQDIITNGIELENDANHPKLTFTEPDRNRVRQINRTDNDNDLNKLYKISTSMSDLKLGNLDADNYLVEIDANEQNGEITGNVDVYFVPGIIADDGITYFYLSEMNKQ